MIVMVIFVGLLWSDVLRMGFWWYYMDWGNWGSLFGHLSMSLIVWFFGFCLDATVSIVQLVDDLCCFFCFCRQVAIEKGIQTISRSLTQLPPVEDFVQDSFKT